MKEKRDMKKTIIAILTILTLITGVCSCSATDPVIPQGDETQTHEPPYEQPQTSYYEPDPEPEIAVSGNAEVSIDGGVLCAVPSNEEYIKDVTVDGTRVWLSNGRYNLGKYSDETQISVTCAPIPEGIDKQDIYCIVLSVYDSSRNAFSLTWHTQNEEMPTVKIRKKNTVGENIITAYCDKTDTDYVNRAVAYDLEYSTTYIYTICDAEGRAKHTAAFTTPDPSAEAVTMLHVSDTQDEQFNGRVWSKLMDSAYSNAENIDMILHTGDMVQYGGEEEQWRQMLGSVRKYITTVPLTLTSGNHSYWSNYKKGVSNIDVSHTTVKLPPQDTANGIYYSYDWADIHYVVLSSGDSERDGIGQQQLQWLEQDLSQTEKKWKIVMIHNPLYSSGTYGSDSTENRVALSMRQTLGAILDKYGVDLVLQGHDHVYSLSKPISSDQIPQQCQIRKQTVNGVETEYFVNPSSPVYLLSGTAGTQNREVYAEHDPQLYQQTDSVPQNTATYSIIQIEADKLTAVYYEYNYETDVCTPVYGWGIDKTAD